MAEWLYEDGIGEARAALVKDGRIIAARIEPEGTGPRAGSVMDARIAEITVKGKEARVELTGGAEAMLHPVPRAATEGGRLRVEITREAIPEPAKPKRAMCKPSDMPVANGPSLLERCKASGRPVDVLGRFGPDLLEQAGWSEVLEEARTGVIPFDGGTLRLSITPAMALFDVDGHGPIERLALTAATAVADAIVRHDIAGSIGVDFPTIGGKEARLAVAQAIDAALPQPFERTAMNGFGFLQIIRPRERASLPEMLRADPIAAEARALLRTISRMTPPVPADHPVRPALAELIASRPQWVDAASRAAGTALRFPAFGGGGA